MRSKLFTRRPAGPKTARVVLHHSDRYLLAIHSSFWRKRHKRWGLIGGGIERAEAPALAVTREVHEELSIDLAADSLVPLGQFHYKGFDHAIFGAQAPTLTTYYDKNELLDSRWFTLEEVVRLSEQGDLHAGYELAAIERFVREKQV